MLVPCRPRTTPAWPTPHWHVPARTSESREPASVTSSAVLSGACSTRSSARVQLGMRMPSCTLALLRTLRRPLVLLGVHGRTFEANQRQERPCTRARVWKAARSSARGRNAQLRVCASSGDVYQNCTKIKTKCASNIYTGERVCRWSSLWRWSWPSLRQESCGARQLRAPACECAGTR